jgi:hypothetical protein
VEELRQRKEAQVSRMEALRDKVQTQSRRLGRALPPGLTDDSDLTDARVSAYWRKFL